MWSPGSGVVLDRVFLFLPPFVFKVNLVWEKTGIVDKYQDKMPQNVTFHQGLHYLLR